MRHGVVDLLVDELWLKPEFPELVILHTHIDSDSDPGNASQRFRTRGHAEKSIRRVELRDPDRLGYPLRYARNKFVVGWVRCAYAVCCRRQL
jgi:hypothetical protein